jgi:Tetratricopeptide repeat
VKLGVAPIEEVERDFKRAFSVIDDGDRVVRNLIVRQYVSVLQYSGRPEDAHRYAAEALIGSIEVFGPQHPETARAWNTIGRSWYYVGDGRRAKIALGLSAGITRKTLGPFHPDLGYNMVFESGLAFVEGDLSTALKKSREATAIYEQVFGPGHEQTLSRSGDSATMLVMLGRYSAGDARKSAYYREADGLLSRIIRTSEHNGVATAFYRDKHAAVQLYFGRIEAAESNALAAVVEAERIFGVKSPVLATAQSSLLQVRVAQGHCGDAQRLRNLLSLELSNEDERDFNDFVLLDMLYDSDIACGDAASALESYSALRRLSERMRLQHVFDTLPGPDTLPSKRRQR